MNDDQNDALAPRYGIQDSDAEDMFQSVALTALRRRRWLQAALSQYFRKGMEYAALRAATRRGLVVGVGGGLELDLVERRGERVQHWLREVSG